jgi:uncharacterized repeat protein (TIGR03803 family)
MQRWLCRACHFTALVWFILAFATNAAVAQYQVAKPDSEIAPARTWTFTDLFRFKGSDGYSSTAGLVEDAAGNLYGTTLNGGVSSDRECLKAGGCGVVFELAPGPNGAWTEAVVHSFTFAKTDGCFPFAGVIVDGGGNLYGATEGCGAFGLGAVFELSPGPDGAWTETLLYSFAGGPADGAVPLGGLLMGADGKLYGTTGYGGTSIDSSACDNKPLPNGCGTVFELTPRADGRWNEKVLYNFAGGSTDGATPPAGVTMDATGNLYGVTKFGDSFQGTVYQLKPGKGGVWTETVLHKFPDGLKDGTYPVGVPALDARGNLFGVTEGGGRKELGTIWEIAPAKQGGWTESVLYTFGEAGPSDANAPYSGVILDANGNLYGTTSAGGGGCQGFGCGTVYVLDGETRKLTRLVDFDDTATNSPEGPLLMDAQGNLYGTTAFGGATANPNCQGVLRGCGTVFKLAP